MNRRTISFAALFTAIFVLYRYRYQMMSNILKNDWIQKIVVRFAMNIPFIRKAFLNQAFH